MIKTRLLCVLFIIGLLSTACTLETSGLGPSYTVWIDAPRDRTEHPVNGIIAIHAHTNFEVNRMVFLVNGVGISEMEITAIDDNLYEGRVFWTPIIPGDYSLTVRAYIPTGRQVGSHVVRVKILGTSTSEMLYVTETSTAPAPTAASFTPIPLAQVNFWSDSPTLARGSCTFLRWNSVFATSLTLNGSPVPLMSSQQVCLNETTSYTLHAEAPSGPVDRTLTISILQPTQTPKPLVTVPADTSGPALSNLSNNPTSVFDGTSCGATSTVVNINATDPSGISKVEITYRAVRGSTQGQWRTLTMTTSGGGNYQITLGPSEFTSSLSLYAPGFVEYTIKAWDTKNNMSQQGGIAIETKTCLI
ncbi:MAG: Uncharacterized protein FD147_2010 [Chloroflexi bacterium]|nr:MAG: Uncharacterized protein FD147_2010 [Chloroflexota bacterium]